MRWLGDAQTQNPQHGRTEWSRLLHTARIARDAIHIVLEQQAAEEGAQLHQARRRRAVDGGGVEPARLLVQLAPRVGRTAAGCRVVQAALEGNGHRRIARAGAVVRGVAQRCRHADGLPRRGVRRGHDEIVRDELAERRIQAADPVAVEGEWRRAEDRVGHGARVRIHAQLGTRAIGVVVHTPLLEGGAGGVGARGSHVVPTPVDGDVALCRGSGGTNGGNEYP